MKSQYKRLAIIPLLVIALLCVPTPASAALPAGFELETIAGGITLPTGMAFAPDGRIFVAGKAGAVHVIKNGVLLPTPLIQLTDVNTYGDRGLIGIAVDPNFSVNHFLYLSYTFENTPGANFSGRKTGRIVRVTVEGDTASESSKFILVGRVGGNSVTPSCDNYAIGTDCIPSDSSSHSVGGLRFGPDGKLYATLGDGSDFDRVDARSERAQNLDSLAGKMLRINTDGSAPADNPYYTTSTANRSKVYAYGFRNMFRFNFRPSTGALYGGDVGWDTWEEVNKITRGGNYGWPCREGDNPAFGQTCTAPGAINPFYSYIHDPQAGGAVVSGAFPGVGAYPAAYNNTMFFGDFALNFIKTLNASTTDTFVGVTDFMDGADGADGPVEFLTGPDGRVYLISIYTGDVRRINYTLGNRLPQASIAATPTSGLAPLNVSFSSAGSSDPDGNPLSYLWNFGDNTTSALANPSHTYTANGTYTAILTVFDGQGGQQTKNVTVNVGNRAPTPTIISPSNGEFYLVGEVLNVSGSATDPENGNLTGSALTWRVILHHNTHSHVLETRIGATFQITGPDHTDPNVYLELELTATDTGGVSAKTSINLYVNNTVSADGNWVRNRSFESADPIKPTLPEFWISNKYGTNTATFTYPVAGDGSAKAVKIDMSGFTDGDAKWSHDPAQVRGGMTFNFSDSYMSTAPSRITAQYGFIDGTVTFEDLAYLPASAVWSRPAVTLITPANAKTLAVYHLIEANGSLTVDNFSLTIPTPPATTTPPVAGNLIGNPSLETAAGTVPAGWANNTWGTNTSVFSYPVAGQDGAKAAKLVVSGYASGDAKWFFDDVAVTAGTTYTFSDYYQSTAPSFLVARFKSSTGVYSYGEIATAPVSAGWSQISKPIIVPANTVALTVFHLLRSNGSLTVDTFALTAPGAPTSTPPGTNLIVNGFMETGASSTTLQGWTPTSVGGITTVFNYPTTGVDTGKAASIQITNYPSGADGNARWQFDEVPVQTGVEYTYESFYKGSTISDIIGRYTFNDNTEHYFGLSKEIPAAVNWTPVTGKFVGPVNVKSVTLMHQIGTIATLSIDNSKLYVSGTGTPAEIVPPVVNFTSPLTGDTVSGIVTLNANATDNVGIAGVFFAVDGTPISAETATAPYTYQWDSRTVADGTHALKVTARDAAGNNNREIITVTVNNSAVTSSNLVFNPSLETANGAGTAPLNWTSNKWGTNTTTFTYPVAGQDGAKGARVAVTAWTSGDAKWYFDDVAVTAGTQYTFKDYYLANVTTDVVVRYKTSAEVFSYVYLATLPANAAFTQSNINFTPPSGIVSATVFHLIAKVGNLTIDTVSVAPTNATPPPPPATTFNFSLSTPQSRTLVRGGSTTTSTTATLVSGTAQSATFSVSSLPGGVTGTFAPTSCTVTCSTTLSLAASASATIGTSTITITATTASTTKSSTFQLVVSSGTTTPPPTPANLILNPSLETGGATPANWSQDFWGTNTRVFTYPVAGQSGTKAAKVTISAFTDGDAKWSWDDVVVTAGKTYLFSDYYQSDVTTSIVIQYTMTNDTYQYVDKGTTVASAAWKQYQTTITPPTGVKSFTVFHLLDKVGSLTVDSASLTVQ